MLLAIRSRPRIHYGTATGPLMDLIRCDSWKKSYPRFIDPSTRCSDCGDSFDPRWVFHGGALHESMCYLLCCRRSSETEDFKRSESGPVYSVISGDSCKLSFSVCWICPQRGFGIYFSSMRSQSRDIRSRLSSENDDEKYAQSTCILLLCEVL